MKVRQIKLTMYDCYDSIGGMKRHDGIETKKEAEAILTKMNDILHNMPFVAAIKAKDRKFMQLQDKLYDLGWLGLCKTQPGRENGGYVQLKLVNRDSKEARDIP